MKQIIAQKANSFNLLSKYPFIAVMISFIVLAIFAGVLTADFVKWDDDIFIFFATKNGGLSLKRIYASFAISGYRYMPLNELVKNTLYHFFHLNPVAYHLVSWLLHGLNSGLLFLIIRKILLLSNESPPSKLRQNYQVKDIKSLHGHINIAAAIATLFWALHPLRVEPVAWAAASLYNQTLFFLSLSTLCYISAVSSEADKKRYIYLMVLAFIFYTLSLFSHSIGLTYFAIFFIFDIFLFKRIGETIGWWKSRAAKKVLLEKIIFSLPSVFVGVMSLMVRVQYTSFWKEPVTLSEFGLIDRIMQAMYVIFYYVWRPFYPMNLSPVYSTLKSFDPLSMPFILSAFSVITLSIVLFIFRRRWSLIWALWLAYIILLIPVMGFFQHPHYHSDRYALLPSICLSILIAFGLTHLIKKFSTLIVAAFLIVISVFGWLSFNQIKIWNNSEALFSHVINTLGDDPYRQDIYFRLGVYLYEKGRTEDAIINLEKTLAINPSHPKAHAFLAEIEYKNNNLLKSIYHLQNLLITEPNNYMAHYRISELYERLNQKQKAAYHFDKAAGLQNSISSVPHNTKTEK